ncbi:MAG: LamB/YcsF family protein [Thermodesulfobacteriota bacterium]
MGQQNVIDLNSDVGESFGLYRLGLDEEVIPLITSANIACGFHAGDPSVMRRTVALAKQYGVAVGAHPGLPDLIGFGRRVMDTTPEEIQDDVTYQVGALQAFVTAQGMTLQHVKPHGALYNMAVAHPEMWGVIAEALAAVDQNLILVALAGPNRKTIEAIPARTGIRVAFEFFGDRAYNPDGSLVSRREPGAVIHDHTQVAERVVKMVKEGTVTARDQSEVQLEADTICVHGDNPEAVTLVRKIGEVLSREGIRMAPTGTFL